MKGKIDFFIIDDSEINNYYTEDLLKEFEFTDSVTSYMNAENALNELLKKIESGEKLPEIIFLDIRMPGMGGFEFVEELEHALDDGEFPCRIFILTSSKHRRDVEAFEKQFLATEFLNKPLERQDVVEVVTKYFSV